MYQLHDLSKTKATEENKKTKNRFMLSVQKSNNERK